MNKKQYLSLSLGLIFLGLSIIGCSGGEKIETGSVSGTVTLDGQPLASGVIQFHPDKDAQGNTLRGKVAQATITDGKYKIDADPGVVIGINKVMISATKVVGKEKQDGVEIDKLEQYLPAKYNSSTTLSLDVKAGANPKDFQLDSK